MKRRSVLGIVGAFAASVLPFGHHEALADRGPRYVPRGFVEMPPGPFVLTRDANEIQVVNTTTETELFGYVIPANYLAGDHAVRLAIAAQYTNNKGSNGHVTLRLKLGSTTMIDTGSLLLSNGSTDAPWQFDLAIAQLAVGSQIAYGIINGYQVGSAAEDETTALTLSVTAELDAASASFDFTKLYATLELL